PRTGDDALLALADLGERFQAHARYTAMTTDERQRLSRGIADLGDRAGISGDDVAHLCALGAKCVDDYLLADRNARDELMAETVRWILDREERIVVSAHNGHVQRCLAHTGDPVLGHLLAPVLGDELVVIGTTRTGGVIPELRFEGEPPRPSFISLENLAPPPPHTLDAVMEATGLPLHLVDLRRVPPETLGAATAICAQSFVVDIDPTRAFDALVHVRSLTPVPRWTRSTPTTVAAAHERPQ
ncbi:MAG: erythromycin esterase family protein, partial [Kutzneria sp.]|nr:erythromycin esterase family protein [Kutzneria sp.]